VLSITYKIRENENTLEKDEKEVASNQISVIVFISPTRQHKPNQPNQTK
jgi:hypothetical protein